MPKDRTCSYNRESLEAVDLGVNGGSPGDVSLEADDEMLAAVEN